MREKCWGELLEKSLMVVCDDNFSFVLCCNYCPYLGPYRDVSVSLEPLCISLENMRQ